MLVSILSLKNKSLMDIKIGWTKNFTIYLRMLKIMWKDIKNAPKVIGCPLWVRGSTTNDLSKCDYFCWGIGKEINGDRMIIQILSI